MTPNEFRSVIDFEKALAVGQPVLVKWTAGSFGHYRAEGTVKRVNACSVRVTLTEVVVERGQLHGLVETGKTLYPVGNEIVVPLITASGNRWAHFNRCEPVGGYPAVA
jgi:hypothetical protein